MDCHDNLWRDSRDTLKKIFQRYDMMAKRYNIPYNKRRKINRSDRPVFIPPNSSTNFGIPLSILLIIVFIVVMTVSFPLEDISNQINAIGTIGQIIIILVIAVIIILIKVHNDKIREKNRLSIK